MHRFTGSLLLAGACVAAPVILSAQEGDLAELADLRTPTSPAFILLGVEPTSIERPTTPRALALGLASDTRNATIIPENYALEVAPYWLSRRDIEFEDYFESRGLATIVQTLSFSFATSRDPEELGDSSTAVAWGVRFVLSRGAPSARAKRVVQALEGRQGRRARLISPIEETRDSLAAARDSLDGANPALTARLTTRIRSLDERLIALESQREHIADSIAALADSLDVDDRVGFVADFAAAVAGAFPGDEFDSGRLHRVGVWTTVGYRTERLPLELLALIRYQSHAGEAEQNLFDLGGRLVLRFGRLSLSGELVNRTVLDIDFDDGASSGNFYFESSNRATSLLEYRLDDDTYLFTGFGRDFEEVRDGGSHPLFATLGLQVHWGAKPAFPVF